MKGRYPPGKKSPPSMDHSQKQVKTREFKREMPPEAKDECDMPKGQRSTYKAKRGKL